MIMFVQIKQVNYLGVIQHVNKEIKMEKEDRLKAKWIYVRNGEVREVFDSRKKAVKYFKALLKQTLKDFDKQDKTLNRQAMI